MVAQLLALQPNRLSAYGGMDHPHGRLIVMVGWVFQRASSGRMDRSVQQAGQVGYIVS